LTCCELDKEYYEKAIQRIKNHVSQQKHVFNHSTYLGGYIYRFIPNKLSMGFKCVKNKRIN